MDNETWVTRDYGAGRGGKAVNLTQSRLGYFTYELLKAGGNIKDVYVMNGKYDRCYVQMLVELPKGMKEDFVKRTGYMLEQPPQLTPA